MQPKKYENLSGVISNRFGKGVDRVIPVRKIALPNLEIPMELPYDAQFSLFIPRHREISGKLIDIFLSKFLKFEHTKKIHESVLFTLRSFW